MSKPEQTFLRCRVREARRQLNWRSSKTAREYLARYYGPSLADKLMTQMVKR